MCASRKSPSTKRRAPLQSDLTGCPLQRVAMDILGPLPLTDRGNKYVLVVGDYFTKWVEVYTMPNMEAGTVAELFVSHFVCSPARENVTLVLQLGLNRLSILMSVKNLLNGSLRFCFYPRHHFKPTTLSLCHLYSWCIKLSNRWTYLSKTIPNIQPLLQPLEDAISKSFLPRLTGYLLALLVQLCGLSIINWLINYF